MIDDLVGAAVELGTQGTLGQCHAYRVGDALPQRTGGGLNARGITIFRVTRGLRVQLTEVFQISHRQVVAGQVEERIGQHGTVAIGEDETVTVVPIGIGRVVLEMVVPEDLSDIRHPHGGARMTRLGLLYGIHTQCTDSVR